MPNNRHRTVNKLKNRMKRFAAVAAGAAILSGGMLQGLPAVVHAAADPGVGNAPVTVSQQINNKDQTGAPVLHDHANAAATAQTTAKTKAPTNFKKVLDVKATAYAPGPHDNDQWGSKTFLGTEVRSGVIAVDPSVIPLGSRVFIQYPDGHGEYAVAEDTGGTIKGNHIDIVRPTVAKAQDFGVQHVQVYVLT
ncbi:MAG: 3D domain-containing protein [Negativicutes bacterium]|nr:3D domain-containing protein [Negativicutes bacterium]